MNRNALDHRQIESRVSHLIDELRQTLERPHVADRDIVERAHDAGDAGNLPHVGEWDRIGRTKPAKRHFHCDTTSLSRANKPSLD